MKLSQFFKLLKSYYNCYFMIYNDIDKCFIELSCKEILFILNELDFNIKNIDVESHYDNICNEYDDGVIVYLYLEENEDLKEILRLKQKRLDKIEEINHMLKDLERQKNYYKQNYTKIKLFLYAMCILTFVFI